MISKAILLVGGALLSYSSVAYAQDAAPAAAAAQEPASAGVTRSGQGGNNFEEIVVTARRTDERLQNVPIAITAVSSAALERRQLVNAKELQIAVPSLRITPSAQGSDALPTFQVRGLAAGVISYFADVPLRNTRAIAANLYDLASVRSL